MSQQLNVRPEELISASGKLTDSQSVATESVASAAGTAVPVPAGADLVSGAAAASFTQYVPGFLQAAADGLVKLAEGAKTLVPIAQSYTATDEDGGAPLEGGGAALLQAAGGGLGPLTALATSIPQMAAQAAPAEAALAADERADDPAQGATVV